ncbi:MAG: hypothetical protein ICV54_13970 [Nostoc sp. C3-bin3]|nr:hypothetical protein [Nostoc sp. C3-bin3]
MQTELRDAFASGSGQSPIAPQEIDRRRNSAIISHPDTGKTTLKLHYRLQVRKVRKTAEIF